MGPLGQCRATGISGIPGSVSREPMPLLGRARGIPDSFLGDRGTEGRGQAATGATSDVEPEACARAEVCGRPAQGP